ncbi:MAG: YhgE/Pip domain-containing protein [Mogibacterium sp.]|nr:YhgE/Pip domain-containing protein [Mogibacterium sp.]MBR2539405.1 YhgE/Pip domain-containing protein [Mogibacterium sp.]
MKNIFNIIGHDLRKCTSSVVAMITIMGLCIIPCLYAWFNIFSNWSPYDSDATGRISVVVANEDKGANAVGIEINVGEKIVSALQANDAIGWKFADSSKEALDGVYASDYYAALIIPEDFSSDALSFISGSLENPKLIYYENEKKNAIAPKITGKAKTAVQEEVNAAFVQTLAGYVADAVSVAEASGYDPQDIFADLSNRIELLSERLDDCIVMLDAASSLSDAADSLLKVSGALTDSAGDAVTSEKKVLDTASTIAPENDSAYTQAIDSVTRINSQTRSNLSALDSRLEAVYQDKDLYNSFVENELDTQKKLVAEMQKSNSSAAESLKTLGLNTLASQFEEQNKDLEAIAAKLDLLVPATDENWPEMQQNVQDIRTIIAGSKGAAIDTALKTDNLSELDRKLRTALQQTSASIEGMKQSLTGLGGILEQLGGVFDGYGSSLGKLDKGVAGTRSNLIAMRSNLDVLAELMAAVAGNQDLAEADSILSENSGRFASYLASPVKMDTSVIYPIETYGSAMAPFYTVLAQWVGALLTAVLIKVKVKERKDLVKPRLYQKFFGRYGLYLIIGLAQALIVSLGDLLYVKIQCLHPVLFVLQACMNGICFMMINYALVFALDNIGMAAGVIILVLQVAGSGGTYPVEVLPDVFKVLYPFMPFRYSMTAMRECIGGTFDHTYAKCMGTLALFFVGSVILGQLLYKPALWINRLIAESKQKSDIML